MIKIYSGLSIEDKCRQQLHPINEVLEAEKIVLMNLPAIVYSNSCDFVMAIKYIALKHNVDVEFFLDGVSAGKDIEIILNSFNVALDMINEKGLTEY